VKKNLGENQSESKRRKLDFDTYSSVSGKNNNTHNHDNNNGNSTNRSLSGTSSKKEKSWVFPNLVVRIISKTFRNGELYLQKARITDVISSSECSIKLLDNPKIGILELNTNMLETVIPKKTNELIKVVRSKSYYGEVGKFLEKKRNKKGDDVVVVQMVEDFSIQEFDLDCVCYYIGDK